MKMDFFAKPWLAAGGPVVILACLSLMNVTPAQASGETDFNTYCGACHSIGQGRRVGPDLAGVHDRRSQDWLEKFVKSSQSVIKSGDAQAVAIAAEYNNMIMPDAIISAAQIKDILSYLEGAGGGAVAAGATEAAGAVSPVPQAAEAVPEPAAAPLSEADIEYGRELFEGSQRLENGGAACNAFHHVLHDAVMGGGILATELTKAFSRMGVPGLKAVIGSAPFPVMQAAYKDKALTE